MSVAFGALRWTPDVFWKSSFPEFIAAYDGWCLVNDVDQKTVEPFSRDDLNDLMEKFPDGTN